MGEREDRVLFMHPEALNDLVDSTREQILYALNSFNPRLQVTRILPLPGGESFSITQEADSTRFGLVAEAEGYASHDIPLAPDEGVAESVNGDLTHYSTIVYVFASPPEPNGRNIFVAQTIFPSLCALIKDMLDAPGAVFSAHPAYFLDLASGPVTESVKRTLLFFAAMGIGYVPVHRTPIAPQDIPRDLDDLLTVFGSSDPPFSLDIARHTVTYSADEFAPGRLLTGESRSGKWTIQGSNEKFYWSTVLPVAVVAARSGWRIDCSQVLSYLQSVHDAANGTKLGTKFYRTVTIFDYIDKIAELNR